MTVTMLHALERPFRVTGEKGVAGIADANGQEIAECYGDKPIAEAITGLLNGAALLSGDVKDAVADLIGRVATSLEGGLETPGELEAEGSVHDRGLVSELRDLLELLKAPALVPAMPAEILITMEGGLIHNVVFEKGAARVTVRDYDVEGADDDRLSLDPNGDECVESVYAPEDHFTTPPWAADALKGGGK